MARATKTGYGSGGDEWKNPKRPKPMGPGKAINDPAIQLQLEIAGERRNLDRLWYWLRHKIAVRRFLRSL